MDYVREELLRQRSALAALLLGRERTAVGVEDAPAGGGPAERAVEETFPVELAAFPMEDGGEKFLSAAPGGWDWTAAAGRRMQLPAGEAAGTRRTVRRGQRWAPTLRREDWPGAAVRMAKAMGPVAPVVPLEPAGAVAPVDPAEEGGTMQVRGPTGGERVLGATGRAAAARAARSGGLAAGAGAAGIGWDGPGSRTVTEVLRPEHGGTPAGAGELSRAFQRDARRYDGGFSLY